MRISNGKFDGVFSSFEEVERSVSIYPRNQIAENKISGNPLDNQDLVELLNDDFSDKDTITIVDHGGGNKCHFRYLKENFGKKLNYIIIDLVDKYPDYFEPEEGVRFYPSVFDVNEKVDVFFSCTGFQYISHPQKAVEHICFNLQPDAVFFQKNPSCFSSKSFVTIDVNKNVPIWVYDELEFIRWFEDTEKYVFLRAGPCRDYIRYDMPKQHQDPYFWSRNQRLYRREFYLVEE